MALRDAAFFCGAAMPSLNSVHSVSSDSVVFLYQKIPIFGNLCCRGEGSSGSVIGLADRGFDSYGNPAQM